MTKPRSIDFVHVSGVPDQVRVGDAIRLSVLAAYKDNFIEGAEINARIKPLDPEPGAAYFLERPDPSGISLDEADMGADMPRETAELFEDIKALHTHQYTNAVGEAIFRIVFDEPGEVLVEVTWYDSLHREYRSEELGVQIFRTGATAVHKDRSVVSVGELDEEEGRKLNLLDIDSLIPEAIASPEPEPDSEPESEEEPAQGSDQPLTMLKADIDVPEEILVGDEFDLAIRVLSNWGGAENKQVIVEAVSKNFEITAEGIHSDNPRKVSGLTDQTGRFVCRVKHTGRTLEAAPLIVSWGDVGSRFRARDYTIAVKPRKMDCDVHYPAHAEVGQEVEVKAQVVYKGRAMSDVQVRLVSDDPNIKVAVMNRVTRLTVEDNWANTDSEGRIDFLLAHVGNTFGDFHGEIQWICDGEEHVQGINIKFAQKKEDKPMPDDKKKTEKKTEKKARRMTLVSVFAVGFVAIAIIAVVLVLWQPPPWSNARNPIADKINGVTAEKGEVAPISEDVPLSATDDEAAAEPDDMAFTIAESEAIEEAPAVEEPLAVVELEEVGDESGEAGMNVPPDAVTYDAVANKVVITDPNLKQDLEEYEKSKFKLKRLNDEVGELEAKLLKSQNTNAGLSEEKAGLKQELGQLKKQIAKLETGAPNLDLVRVDKIVCHGQYKKIKKNGKIVAVEVPECDVYLSAIKPKK